MVESEEPKTTPSHHPTQQQGGRRRQGTGNRAWLVVTETGDSRLDEVSKHQIMRRTGLPARDLRALDPALSYPSSILGRERAIVVNFEHIKAIVTATEVLMVNSPNPLVVDFVEDLQHRIFHQGKGSSETYTEGGGKTTWSTPSSDHRSSASSSEPLIKRKGRGLGRALNSLGVAIRGSVEKNEVVDESPVGSSGADTRSLPFEFRALEACLESTCRCLESETMTLELEAYPALDELTSHISTLNLERVRQIKSRLVAISGRVQKVRDELEHLLDDDNDMAEMYLTEKLNKLSMEQQQVSVGTEPEFDPVQDDDADDDDDETTEDYEYSKSYRTSDACTYAKPNIEELEMLLEAYFAQVDGISQKLSTMSEYVKDTEDYINIMLDEKQNQLLQMGVMLSAANMIINAGIVVVGIFGMNINIPLFEGAGNRQFLGTALGTIGCCIILYIFAVSWAKKRYLLSL